MMFEKRYQAIMNLMAFAPVVPQNRWQSLDVSDKPWMAIRELLNHTFSYQVPPTLEELAADVKPNLPWADVHFEKERVSGEPINPGESWKLWPGADSAETMIHGQQYDHSYAERYWPKFAGQTTGGKLVPGGPKVLRGIRYQYGDLDDLVELLRKDPSTRQAYLPVWFPEDLTAANNDARVPCSLGYHFIFRDDRLHVNYFMRSCDVIKHLRDDVYLTARLLLWICQRINMKPGKLTMFTTSLHIFEADWKRYERTL